MHPGKWAIESTAPAVHLELSFLALSPGYWGKPPVHRPDQIPSFFESLPWIIMTGFVFVTLPTSIIIKKIISPWQPKDESNKWQALGFLLTAKSVFRFKNISNTKTEMPLTEYILLGTLLSFGFAIVTGLVIYNMAP